LPPNIQTDVETGRPESLGAIVLCGGESRRMGRAKPWLDWGSQTLLQHAVAVLRQATPEVVVVAAPGQKLPELPAEVQRLDDSVRYEGPLCGMQIGLEALAKSCSHAFVMGCDSPFITPAFIDEIAHRVGSYEIVVPKDDQFFHPLAAIYQTSLSPRVLELIQKGKRKPRFLLDQSKTLALDPRQLQSYDPSGLTLQNLNTPDDYTAALKRYQQNQEESSS
jgi:molybdopterin-guanine dinucleotide biosynthesis protein A